MKGRVFHWDFKGEDILDWDWSMIEFSWIHSINDYKPKSTSVKFNSLELDTELFFNSPFAAKRGFWRWRTAFAAKRGFWTWRTHGRPPHFLTENASVMERQTSKLTRKIAPFIVLVGSCRLQNFEEDDIVDFSKAFILFDYKGFKDFDKGEMRNALNLSGAK